MLVTTRGSDAIPAPPIHSAPVLDHSSSADPELRALSISGLWPRVKLLSQDQNWWHSRVCHLLRRPIPREKACWQHIYNSLVLHERKCPILVRLLIEEGADPSIPITYDAKRHAGKLFRLVSRGPRVVTTSPLVLYSRAGNAQAVTALLADPRVDPTWRRVSPFEKRVCTLGLRCCSCYYAMVDLIRVLGRTRHSGER